MDSESDRVSASREFPIEDVLTVVTGKLLVEDMGRVYRIMAHMLGVTPLTHQLPRALAVCGRAIMEQHPLSRAVALVWRVTRENAAETLAEIRLLIGADTLAIQPLPIGRWTDCDPVQELADMMAARRRQRKERRPVPAPQERSLAVMLDDEDEGLSPRSTYYLDWFLNLKCADDVLTAASPIGHRAAKEITEAVAVVKAVRHLLLAGHASTKAGFETMRGWRLVDLASGNALVPVIAAHLFPLDWCLAADKRPRKRAWENVRRFGYLAACVDIAKDDVALSLLFPARGADATFSGVVVTAVHPCGELAEAVVRHFLRDANCRHLVLMPCCADGKPHSYGWLDDRLGGYDRWCLSLCDALRDAGCSVSAKRDPFVLSPCNVVITASKPPAPDWPKVFEKEMTVPVEVDWLTMPKTKTLDAASVVGKEMAGIFSGAGGKSGASESVRTGAAGLP